MTDTLTDFPYGPERPPDAPEPYRRREPAGPQPSALQRRLRPIVPYVARTKSRLAPSAIVEILSDYAANLKVDDIARKRGVRCSSWICRIARRACLPRRRKAAVRINENIRRAIIEDYRNDVPVGEIAQTHRVDPTWVRKLARRAGIDPRPYDARNRRDLIIKQTRSTGATQETRP